ncbi:hypothetical protein PSV08DRAFT_336697 [Bipolaris maydis]|uniref:uncharacterized protein n=1 Tax=Cochliobolus heterostrophus TaxID=5016 RepID=UPI0024D7797F|nr:hypothetical protein PSV08DRAFT_336697 [Bipolaris maydis]KAJ6281289.1 hypothetical protein J3E71DRAFT_299363 [Bipolaris maydis]
MNFIGSENLRTTTRTPSFVFAGAWDLHCAVALLSLFPCVWEFCLLNGVFFLLAFVQVVYIFLKSQVNSYASSWNRQRRAWKWCLYIHL